MSSNYWCDSMIRKGVRFFHAINLGAFTRYCEAGALLSRELLLRDHSCTPFWSDDSDGERGVLGRVFGNLYDFGAIYARAQKSVPNIYGPIAMLFSSGVFQEMDDVVVTRNSIAVLQGPWRSHAIDDHNEIDTILSGDECSNHIHSGPPKKYEYVELSCSNVSLSFSCFSRIIVDDLQIEGRSLLELVREIINAHNVQVIVQARQYSQGGNLRQLQKVVRALHSSPAENVNMPSWVTARGQQSFLKWMKYFQEDTIEFLRRDSQSGG